VFVYALTAKAAVLDINRMKNLISFCVLQVQSFILLVLDLVGEIRCFRPGSQTRGPLATCGPQGDAFWKFLNN